MTPLKKHHIKLEADERESPAKLARSGKASAIKVQRAKAMLAMDIGPAGPALPDSKTVQLSGLSIRPLERLRKRACEAGPIGALERKPRPAPPVEPKVTGAAEAMMVKIACSEAPADAALWTMRTIAERLVELEVVESISSETVRTTLEKTTSSHGGRSAGASRRRRTPPSWRRR